MRADYQPQSIIFGKKFCHASLKKPFILIPFQQQISLKEQSYYYERDVDVDLMHKYALYLDIDNQMTDT